ncbi:MAG: aminotransferase class V-fold PLP-dependent enzyme, partial [Bryobacteraceae bacterium]
LDSRKLHFTAPFSFLTPFPRAAYAQKTMPHRRQFLQSVTASALAAPWLPSAASAEDPTDAPSLPSAADPAYWDKLRDHFLLARDKVFFNNGTIGAMPRVVLDRTVEHLRRMATDLADWDYRGPNWIGGYDPMESMRTKAARLVNADMKEIALTENVTCANSYIAAGLDLPTGVEILMSDQEHPGGECPWLTAAKRHSGAVVQVALPRPAHHPEELVDLVERAFTPRTRVLYLSHVITGSGAIVPVKEICAAARSRGILTVIDGAQALGHIPVDVRDIGCDAYVACFHKWLLAPAGNGFLYIRGDREKDVWTTLASANWANHDDDGYRLTQRGTGSMSLMVGAEAALDFHFAIGPARVQQRIKQLGERLRSGLREIPEATIYSPEDPAMCAGITVYSIKGLTGAQLQDEMWNRGRLRPRALGNGVRQCTHIFNSPSEIDRTLEIARAVARG